jgi:transcriptional regulator with XRE-family HTH domain
MNAQEICQRIRGLRQVRQIKQSELAEALGLSQSSYAKMEKGQTKLSLDRFIQIMNYLDTDPQFFFKENVEAKPSAKKPYSQSPAAKTQWEERLGYNLYIVARQNEELMGLLEGIKPRSA